MKMGEVFIPELGVTKVEYFSRVYPDINEFLLQFADWQESRDGKVKEILDFKTIITNPYRRCVGGYKRNINIFFLLAEAMWIALGRKDVKTLVWFNKNMEKFSDDGKVFHAPYGFRLRHWGVRSEDKFEPGISTAQGFDQVINAIKILAENPNSRQVVMSIWNPEFDLGFRTKDTPCNDMVMLKIRDGKLITTIANRSNDLHWGLPTNIFQFSFLTEIMAACLDVELGTQTHNSQSLHIYEWNDIADIMQAEYRSEEAVELYASGCEARHMDFKFIHEYPANRYREIEYYMSFIFNSLGRIIEGENELTDEIEKMKEFSSYLYGVYCLLKIYTEYKMKLSSCKNAGEKDVVRMTALSEIEVLEKQTSIENWDVSVLAKNFFVSRLSFKDENEKVLGNL